MKKFALFFLLLCVISCAEKVMEKPDNLIPKEKMVLILYDLAIINAVNSSTTSRIGENKVETMDFLYRKYDMDSVQFSQSDLYYASIPLEYEEIYEKVDALLEEKKKMLEDENTRRNDSIRKANEELKDSSKIKEQALKNITSDS